MQAQKWFARNKPKMHNNGLTDATWLWQKCALAIPHNGIVDSTCTKWIATHKTRKHTNKCKHHRDICAKKPQRILRTARIIAAACAKKHGRYKELISTQQGTNTDSTRCRHADKQTAQETIDSASQYIHCRAFALWNRGKSFGLQIPK